MYDRWETNEATESQIKYIKTLITNKAIYILRVDLDNLSRGEASNLIQALVYDTDEKLIAEKILKLKPTPMTKEEFEIKIKEDYKDRLLSTVQCSKVRYKVSGSLHVWGWTDFRREINGKIIEYDTSGNIINSIIYEVEKEMDKNILGKYGLTAEKINKD